jgi:hypothetical protein
MEIGVDAYHSLDISTLMLTIFGSLKSFFNAPGLYAWLNSLSASMPAILNQVVRISFFVSGICLFFVIYYGWKIFKMLEDDKHMRMAAQPAGATMANMVVVDKIKERWGKVLEHAHSTDPSAWKMSILEADIMLDEMLDRQQYPGESIGDKLKNVERSDFLTLDQAWEAHKVRNQIAHEGSQFLISQRETMRVIGLYEAVFNEFELI